jgi:MFS family permease
MSGAKGYSEFKKGWPVVAASMFGIGLGLSPVPFYTIGMFAPHLAKEFGWSFQNIFAGLTVMSAAVVIVGPMVGFVAQRFGLRLVTLISVVLFGLSFMGFGLSNGSLAFFYANWAIMAVLGAATLPITWTRAVNNWFDERKGLAIGIAMMGTGVFGFFSKPFVGWMIVEHGWRAAYFAVGALPLLIALPIALWGFRDIDDPKITKGAAVSAAVLPGMTYKEALKDWRFYVLLVSFVAISFALGGPVPTMEGILRTNGFSDSAIPWMAGLIGISAVAGRLVGGWLIDKFWAPAVGFVLLSAPAIGFWFFAHGPLNTETAVISIVLIGFALGVEFDLMSYLIARYFGTKSYAAIYGTLYGFFAGGSGVSPMLFGRSFDQTGSYDSMLMFGFVILLIASAMLLTLGRYRVFSAEEPKEAKAETA